MALRNDGKWTATEIKQLQDYVNDRRLHTNFNRLINSIIGESFRAGIHADRIDYSSRVVIKQRSQMIIHNASPKFIQLHERRIKAVLHNGGGNPKWVAIKLIEPLEEFPTDFRGVVLDKIAVQYVVQLELISSFDEDTGDIVLSPLTETDLTTIEEWEKRNENFELNKS